MNSDTQRNVRAYLGSELKIGAEVETGAGVYLSLDVLKETSAIIVGAAGSGKTRFMSQIINELIAHRQGCTIVDPHGDLCRFSLSALRKSSIDPARVVVIDPSNAKVSVGFNPLQVVDDPGEVSALVRDALAKAWNAGFDETPRLDRVLTGMFRLLAESGLTLLESYDFLDVDAGHLRTALRERCTDPIVRQDWLEFEKLSRAERLSLVESARNRIRRSIQDARIQRMLGQTKAVLNINRMMEDGRFVLVNLGGLASSPEAQRFLGTLILNSIFHAAKRRRIGQGPHHFVVVDECGQFATADLAESLDQLRKFRTHFVLACQRLKQLERGESEVLSSVMTNARVKVAFGGLERPEAERMAREMFTGSVTGNCVKHIAYGTRFRPIHDVFEVVSESFTEGEGETDGSSWTDSSTEVSQASESAAYEIDDDNRNGNHDEEDVVGRTAALSTAHSQGYSRSGSTATQRSRSASRSVSTVPITRYEEFREETGRQFSSIEEQFEARTSQVHGLAKREALLRIHNGPVVHFRTLDIETEIDGRARDRFVARSLARCDCAHAAAVVDAETADRKRRVEALAAGQPSSRVREQVRTFRE